MSFFVGAVDKKKKYIDLIFFPDVQIHIKLFQFQKMNIFPRSEHDINMECGK